MVDNKEINLVKSYLLAKESAMLTISGDSMSPTLKNGWKVMINPVSAKETALGDIVVFENNGLVCHRVIEKFKWNKRLYLIHRGDAENTGRIFEETDLIGIVTEVFDDNNRKIEKKLWRRLAYPSLKFKLLFPVFLCLFIIKRKFFYKKQSKLNCFVRKIFLKL